MSLYTYKAFNSQGKKVHGTIEAESIDDAKQKVQALDLLLFDIGFQKHPPKKSVLTGDKLVLVTGHLAQLLSAKIPLYESLLALEEQSREEPYHPVILGICERIKKGISLSQAMADFGNSFPPLYRALIQAGEAIGSLDSSLEKLKDLLTRQSILKKQIVSALLYPAILFCLLLGAIVILVQFVIPGVETLFEGKTLPEFTQIVLGISHFLQDYGIIFAVLLISSLFFCYYHLKKPKNKRKFQFWILKKPIIGPFLITAALTRFSRTLSSLLKGGIPLAQAIVFAQESLQNTHLVAIFKEVEQRILSGISLSGALLQHKEIPLLFCRMIKIGEESGTLAAMLEQIALLYEEETKRTLSRLLTFIQPVLLLLMGVIIGGVLLSVLLPLSDFGNSMDM